MTVRANGESTKGVGIWHSYSPIVSGGYISGGNPLYTYSGVTATINLDDVNGTKGITATYLYQASSVTITTGMGVQITGMSNNQFTGTYLVGDTGTAYSNYRFFTVNLQTTAIDIKPGTVTSGALKTIVLPAYQPLLSSLGVGTLISGTGVTSGTKITDVSLDRSTITVDTNITAGVNVPFTFYPPQTTGGTVSAYNSGLWDIGNGNCVGKYSIIGDTVNFNGSLKIGSTTVVGDNYLTISLPVPSAQGDINSRYPTLGSGRTDLSNFKGNSFAYSSPMICAQMSTNTFEPQILYVSSTGSNYPIARAGLYSGNYTRTTNDLILFSGTYESA
jgi:hypothetical protein